MELPLLLKALILGVVEGITEFLPVSSTGHLILVGDLLDFNTDKGKLFEIVIQCGAILAIVWEYRAKLTAVISRLPSDPHARRFAANLLVAFLPVAVLGLLFGKAIKELLFDKMAGINANPVVRLIVNAISTTAGARSAAVANRKTPRQHPRQPNPHARFNPARALRSFHIRSSRPSPTYPFKIQPHEISAKFA